MLRLVWDKLTPQTWPVCHVIDNTTLYIQILRAILEDRELGSGKNGYFLASPGSVAWEDIYDAMAVALARRKIIDDDDVKPATKEIQEEMGKALKCPAELVPMQLGGR